MRKTWIKSVQAVLLSVIFVAGAAFAEEAKPQEMPKKPDVLPREQVLKIKKDDLVLGNEKAKVTIVEYASMSCSHCAGFHNNTFDELKEKYVDTGKVRFVFRHFPLDEQALRGSMIASCAPKDKAYKFLDVMFTTQSNWVRKKNYVEILANIAKLGGMSSERFEECMADSVLERQILEGKFHAVTSLDVRSTPTFFINGEKYDGARGTEFFVKTIDGLLAQ
jgi:protein-disulfide isomerase